MKSNLTRKIRIGVDISQLVHTKYLAGPQRVLRATLDSLLKISTESNIEILAINMSGRDSTLNSETLLYKYCVELNDLDIILLVDANNHYVIEEIYKSNFRGLVVSILHDVLPLKHYEWYKFKNRPNYPFEFKFYMMRMERFSQIIVSPSQENVEDCRKYLNEKIVEKIRVIPFGSFWDSEISAKKLHPDPHKGIICVNTLEPKKGHVDILNAFELICQRNQNWILYLVGKEGWNSENLKFRITENKYYGKNLFWFENLNDAQIFELYKKCSIAVNASHAEGFGLTVEEGLSQGMKVICRDIPVFRERSHNNLYFFSGGGLQLADKIEFVFNQNCDDYQNVRTMKDFTIELLSYLLMQIQVRN